MTHSWANKSALVLLAVIVIFTTVAYGAVHQPILAFFYLLVGILVLLWAVDALVTGQLRFSRNMLQLPLIAAAVYGFIQTVPFGAVADFAGVSGIPYTISLNPFATKLSAIHFLALFLLFAVMLVLLDSASRIRRMTLVIVIFGFAYAFFAILQSVLSPLKIYGIFEAGSSFGSFVNRHNFAAYMEMTMALPLGLLFAGAVSRDKRLLYLTGIGLMGVALLLSGSRGGLIAFLAEVIFLTILVTGTRHRKRLALKLALAGALVLAIV